TSTLSLASTCAHRYLHSFPTRRSSDLFGPKPSWYPSFLPFSPALLILWIPGLFRLTCYYYRGAYYKSFWADPPACAVGSAQNDRSEEHTSELQSRFDLVCRLLLEKKK